MKKEPQSENTVETQNNSTPRSLHTPGPWSVSVLGEPVPPPEGITESQRARWNEIQKDMSRPFRHNDGSFNIAAGRNEDRKQVAAATFQGKAKRGQTYSAPDPEGLANARLIAAAPELLDALLGLLREAEETWRIGETFDGRDGVIKAAQAAIAKAEGASSVPDASESATASSKQ